MAPALSPGLPWRRLMIDAHVHFYNPGRPGGISHPTPDNPRLYRRMMPEEFRPLAAAGGMRGVVMIECSLRPEDNAWALALAHAEPLIRAYIGYLDATAADFPGQLKRQARDPLFRGMRLRPGSLANPAVRHALGLLADLDLVLDVLIDEAELPELIRLAHELPSLRIMLDHLGLLRPGMPVSLNRWSDQLMRLAACPAVCCKLSALTETSGHPADQARLLETADAAFGPGRLVFGSNWPPCLQAGSYASAIGIVPQYFAGRGAASLTAVMGGNAARCYGGPRFPD